MTDPIAASSSPSSTQDLICGLDFQTVPGYHTLVSGRCRNGHAARAGGKDLCAPCIDAALLAAGIDITKGGSQFAYERVDGRIVRKQTGASNA